MLSVAVALMVAVCVVPPVLAQQTSGLQSYTYSTGVGTASSWLNPTPSYPSLVTGDDQASAVCNLDFPFYFDGDIYTSFSVNTNGTLRLGNSNVSASNYSYPFSSGNVAINTPKIVAVGADLYGTSLYYGVAGTAPNRVGVFTFEGYPYSGSAYTFSFQVQLYENTGEIRMVYGSCSNTVLSRVFQIGISSSASDVVLVNQTSHTVSYSPSSNAYDTWPEQYRYYSFVPSGSITCTHPYNLSVTQVGSNAVSLDWQYYSRQQSQLSFLVEYGTTGFTQGSGTQISVASPPVLISGLQPDTEYVFYVRSVCDIYDTSNYSRSSSYYICSNYSNTCLDFAALAGSGVTCTYGTYNSYNNYTSSYPGPFANTGVVDYGQNAYGDYSNPGSRHTVHTRVGEMDSCSGWQLSKIPPGECKSVRLGCLYGAYLCQAVSYDITVDTNVSDILLLKYACVFYNPSHPDHQQPRFVLEVLDSAGNMVDASCGSADFNSSDASSDTTGWHPGISNGIYWKDWTPVGLYLAAYQGQTIKVRLSSFACGQGASTHFGYAYYTLSCTKAKIRSSSCTMGEQTTLSAPLGFNYRWYAANDTSVTLSTNRQVSVILDSTIYYCDVSFIDAPNCKFRMMYNHVVASDTIRDTLRTAICPGGSFVQNGDTMTTAGWYRQELITTNGCDSLLYINLTVNDTLRDTILRTICAGGTFDTNGVQYCRQGNYSQLLRDPSSGCYRRLYINLAVNDTLRDTILRTICAGGAFDTNGVQYSRQGMYSQLLRDPSSGCYRRLYINLAVNDTLRDTILRTICAGGAFDTNGVQYCRQGMYSQLLRDQSSGCYRRLYINLTVNDTLRDTILRTICAGGTFDTNGISYRRAGVYRQYFQDANLLCGRSLVIILAVNDTLRDTILRTICAGGTFDTNGHRYTLPGSYSQLLRDQSSGCYRRLYINLTVNDTLRDTIRRTICAGGTFDTNGHRYSLPGSYSQLLRDQGSGCYRRLYINLAVNDTLRDTIRRTICAGATFDTNGHRYSFPGIYSQLLRDQGSGCYRRLYINLAVNDTLRDTIPRTICAGGTFDTNGQQYTLPGIYSQLLRDQSSGCYRRLYINLAVNDTFRTEIWASVCAGAVYSHGGQAYSLQGTYYQRLASVHGCDSLTVIHLTVNDTIRNTLEQTLCAGQSYTYNNVVYSVAGWYRQDFRTTNGCDSILHLHLIVSDTLRDTVYLSTCAGQAVEVNGQIYSTAGWHRQNLRTANGCDSVLHIALMVADTIRTTISDTICMGQTYSYNGNNYTATGVYRNLLRTSGGCDSLVMLKLFVHDTSLIHIYDTIDVGNSYSFYGQTCDSTGVYSHHSTKVSNGCDSTILLHLYACRPHRTELFDTICQGYNFFFAGHVLVNQGVYYDTLLDVYGCDSIIKLNLTVLPYPTLSLSDSGFYCAGGVATIVANTNANAILWSSYPMDSTLSGQETNMVIYVSPQRLTSYTATVDIQPYNCFSTATIDVNKPSMLVAAMAVNPPQITEDHLQTMFADNSIGDVVWRRWLFHEDNPTAADYLRLNDSIVYYTPTPASDTLEVSLVVANAQGCHDTVVNVLPILKGDLWVPTAFTPDRRGYGNNLFKVGVHNVLEYEISIYSREGLLVFHSTNPQASWDGTYKYRDCKPGSYVYVVRYTTQKDPGHTLEKTGSVLLIR